MPRLDAASSLISLLHTPRGLFLKQFLTDSATDLPDAFRCPSPTPTCSRSLAAAGISPLPLARSMLTVPIIHSGSGYTL
jgi:hypothetical protein